MPGARPASILLACLVLSMSAPSLDSRADELPSSSPAPAAVPARRIVSMNPSLTSILVTLDAADALVGVEEHAARVHAELASLPVVGGLFNPSLEAVVALEPDLVILVPSVEQRDFRTRLEALGIEVLSLPNISVEEILASIEILGARVDREARARERVAAIRSAFETTRSLTSAAEPLRTIVVLQRDPLYVVGRGSFIDQMIEASGGSNVAAGFVEPYPRVDVEWLVGAAPEVILDATADPPDAAAYWSRWPSIPAVANGRAISLPRTATFPGPDIDRSLRSVAERIHPQLPRVGLAADDPRP